MEPRAWIGYLVGYTASNIWQIWNPKTNSVTIERDVEFLEDVVYDPDQPFHQLTERVKMPENVAVQAMPDIPEIEIQPPPNDDEAIPRSGMEAWLVVELGGVFRHVQRVG
jgi:hypothetical protein